VAKATLIWVSRDGDETRVFRLPRAVVQGLVGGFCGFLLAAVGGLWWGASQHAGAEAERARVLSLEQELVSLGQSLDERQAEVRSARRQKEALEAEVLRIQDVDQKIRRLLGLNAPDYDADTAHQGGLGPAERGARALPEEDLSAGAAAPPLVASLGDPRTLQTSLQEVLDHLEDRQAASRTYPMLLPVSSEEAWLSCAFGKRTSPFSSTRTEFHNGLDIAGPWKDPILAPADGRVIRVGKDRLLGNYIKIEHSAKIKTLYGHLAAAKVESGARVKRGQVIGIMGNTGRSTGTHLHYSVSVDGKYVDPQDYIWDRPFHRLKL
jgi:murein DD-endopeptidase MepM/ murein hydrolase activator NlpD